MTPQDHLTTALQLHNPQRAGALDGGPHGWVPVDTHSTPVLPKWEEAVGSSPTAHRCHEGMEGPFTTEADSANTNRLTETTLTHHNFQIFDVPYLKKVIAKVRQKLSRQEEAQMLDLEINGFHVSDNEGSSSPRTRLRTKSVYYQEHRLRAAPMIVRYFAKFHLESRK